MKPYKLTYPISLKGTPGGFCITPMEIVDSMNRARSQAMTSLRDFVAAEGLSAEVGAYRPMMTEAALLVTCTEAAAEKLKAAPFVRELTPHTPAPPRFPRFGL